MIRLALPVCPTDNHLYTIAEGRKVLSAQGRAYYHTVAQLCMIQLVGIPRPLTGRLGIWLFFYPPDRRRRDLSNGCKALADSLQKAGIYLDDEQIDAWHLFRCAQVPGGKVEVTIIELEYETFSL
jgi:crossover junction endodeoxyribonuclease RusA